MWPHCGPRLPGPSDDIAGLDEPVRPGGRRRTPKQETFTAFLTGGMASDEWPFMLVGESRRPVDFIAALLADTDPDDSDDECLWLTLEDFAFRLGDAARALGPPSLVEAAYRVVSLLEAPGPSPRLGYYADAIHALSMEIERLTVGCE